MARGKHARGKRLPPSVRKPQATTTTTEPTLPPPQSPEASPESPHSPTSPSPELEPEPTPRLPSRSWPRPSKRVPSPPPSCCRTWTLLVQWPPTRGFPLRLLTIHGGYPRHHFAEYRCPKKVTRRTFPKWLGKLLFPVWCDLVYSDGSDYDKCVEFWIYEWNKHGKFSGLNLRDYFLTVLALYRLIPTPTDLPVLLGEFGVLQDLKDLRQRFFDAIEVDIGVKGFFEGDRGHKICYVLELSFEIDPHTETFVDVQARCLGHVDKDVKQVMFPSPESPLPREVMQKREAKRKEAKEKREAQEKEKREAKEKEAAKK